MNGIEPLHMYDNTVGYESVEVIISSCFYSYHQLESMIKLFKGRCNSENNKYSSKNKELNKPAN
jgi:hypothetical protein